MQYIPRSFWKKVWEAQKDPDLWDLVQNPGWGNNRWPTSDWRHDRWLNRKHDHWTTTGWKSEIRQVMGGQDHEEWWILRRGPTGAYKGTPQGRKCYRGQEDQTSFHTVSRRKTGREGSENKLWSMQWMLSSENRRGTESLQNIDPHLIVWLQPSITWQNINEKAGSGPEDEYP